MFPTFSVLYNVYIQYPIFDICRWLGYKWKIMFGHVFFYFHSHFICDGFYMFHTWRNLICHTLLEFQPPMGASFYLLWRTEAFGCNKRALWAHRSFYRTNRWTNRRTNGRTNGHTNKRKDKQRDRRTTGLKGVRKIAKQINLGLNLATLQLLWSPSNTMLTLNYIH